MTTHTSTPYPLGATKKQHGWNFALFSTREIIQLVTAPINQPTQLTYHEVTAEKNRTGFIWHYFLKTDAQALYYGWKIGDDARIFIDPYAAVVDTGNQFGNNLWKQFNTGTRLFGIASVQPEFDWQSIPKPNLAVSDLIIYEMHVRAFTAHSSSKVAHPGTFHGMKEKIPYLKELGITAVELLPIFEWNESEYDRVNPHTNELLHNFWGYSPLSFFSPMQRYCTSPNPLQILTECKELVRELHKNNIEVILDIVFNHTGEGNQLGPTYSFKAFSPNDYYLISDTGEYLNFSGCGNTLNCNNPIVQDLILDSLRYWAVNFQIDGFRFDLASSMTRDRYGKPLEISPLLERITQDPILQHCKLIAEPWDAAGLHQVGNFFQNYHHGASRWREWNDDFRNCVRRFIKGDGGMRGRFATKLAGSQDVYGNGGSPLNSVNYITSHDGFTLHDLVSYNGKHNLENGENNQDGMNHNDSWNCGTEGETADESALQLRARQMKNYLVAEMMALGCPMIHMGDEYGHTKQGNNNSWCQDNTLNYFSWNAIKDASSFFRFAKGIIHFRKNEPLLKYTRFLTEQDITWHGVTPQSCDWNESSKFIAYTLHDPIASKDLYVAFNAHHYPVNITIPQPKEGYQWIWIVNTEQLPPHDFVSQLTALPVIDTQIKMDRYSSIILKQY